jgi:hypothetical protein
VAEPAFFDQADDDGPPARLTKELARWVEAAAGDDFLLAVSPNGPISMRDQGDTAIRRRAVSVGTSALTIPVGSLVPCR